MDHIYIICRPVRVKTNASMHRMFLLEKISIKILHVAIFYLAGPHLYATFQSKHGYK